MSLLPRGEKTRPRKTIEEENPQDEITTDVRPILSLWVPGAPYHLARVGDNGATSIVAYNECGEMAAVPWFRWYRGSEVAGRVAARHVVVEYEVAR